MIGWCLRLSPPADSRGMRACSLISAESARLFVGLFSPDQEVGRSNCFEHTGSVLAHSEFLVSRRVCPNRKTRRIGSQAVLCFCLP
jgi:hypothetical protein